MKKSQIQQQPQIDLAKTTSVPNDSGGQLFQQGFILRKVSRFITNGAEDAVLPIPVFMIRKQVKFLKTLCPPS